LSFQEYLAAEEEWEKAARGTEGWKYPWGNGMCNSLESGIRMTTPVDKFGVGKSVFGCNDMAGNVWEWTGSRYDEDGYI
jgi:formylglycine-generating enzyme required for sulfatase activity